MRLRYVPAMTRIEIPLPQPIRAKVIRRCHSAGSVRKIRCSVSFCAESSARAKAFAAGQFKQLSVAQRIGDVKPTVAGLASAEEFAGPRSCRSSLGDFESVGSAHHGLEPHASSSVMPGARPEYNATYPRRGHTPAKLMELREPKAPACSHDHYGGVRHVDADFHDRCRDETCASFCESSHDFVFFVAGEPSMHRSSSV